MQAILTVKTQIYRMKTIITQTLYIHCHENNMQLQTKLGTIHSTDPSWIVRPPVKCGCAELRMFKRVNCGEILRGLSADVMGKMRKCGYVITLSSSSSVS